MAGHQHNATLSELARLGHTRIGMVAATKTLRRALDLLVSLFQSGERGAPATPLRLLVEGRWINGDTTRRIKALLDRLS